MLINTDFIKTVLNGLLAKINNKADKSDVVQSDYEQNDTAQFDYIKNRTHYDSRVIKKNTISYEGRELGANDVVAVGGPPFFKFNDSVLSVSDIIGAQLTIEDYTTEIKLEMIQNHDSCWVIITGGYAIMCIIKENQDHPFALGKTPGLWCIANQSSSSTFIVPSISITYTTQTGELKKLDEKYLPDILIDNIENKMDRHNPTGFGSFSMNRKADTVIGRNSHAEGYNTTASYDYTHAEGMYTESSGYASHAEGDDTTSSGRGSHAEGCYTIASNYASHAEGNETIASGRNSHAEGYNTTSSGTNSHAEGCYTVASGINSHAQGNHTEATNYSQHVQGEYNILDPSNNEAGTRGKYAHIVGNGIDDTARSNAHTLDWNGVGWFQGGLQVGGNAQDVGAKNVLLEGVASNCIVLKDAINGIEYVVNMQNGNLVSSCKLANIQVTTAPTKINYIDGDSFDKTDMIVTATYHDGTTKIIDNYIYDEFVFSSKDFIISYEEYGIVYITTVSNFTIVPFDPAIHLIDFDYTENTDGTYTITNWKQTLNGKPSTEMIIPNNCHIVL